jgi:acetyltransferase-like isoleucine patch superfamily enzyme
MIEEYVFFGHKVSEITGTHDYNKFGLERMNFDSNKRNDILIKEGAWVASNAIIISPCTIASIQ